MEGYTLEDAQRAVGQLLDYSDSPEEMARMREFLNQPEPRHRELFISIRDDALRQNEWSWTVLLSHFIAAMTEPAFWEGSPVGLFFDTGKVVRVLEP